MSGRLLEIAVRPLRIAFFLGSNPSTRLINSVISANSGLWGGIHNFICPTEGATIPEEYLELIREHSPDCIAFCGYFSDRQNIIDQLNNNDIRPSFMYTNVGVRDFERLGIGIEGIFDSKFLQDLRRGVLVETAIVNPRLGRATLLDRFIYGVPPDRLREYMEGRVYFITVGRYKKESQLSQSGFDELMGIIEVTGENLERLRAVGGIRRIHPPYGIGRPYFVVGLEDSLEDACYFWNLRAIFGVDRVRWVALNDLESFLRKWGGVAHLAREAMIILTSRPTSHEAHIKKAVRKSRSEGSSVRYLTAKFIFNTAPNWTWQSERRREHVATDDGEFVVPCRRPSSFELVYPERSPRWVMDLRVVRDDAIGTQGFILPDFSYLYGIVTPARTTRLRPRILGDTFSLQVTSAPIDEHIRFRIPTDWEVLQAVFGQGGYRVCLSDQGNYMSRAIALFGGLPRLSALLSDAKATAVLDEFLKHHRTGERMGGEGGYRRRLTLENMREVVLKLTGRRSRKRREESFRFVDQLLRELIRLGAVYSGYMLDCSSCNLEEWYPIHEVAETFRCRRCLAVETRPPSPPIFFHLNEALYQAYTHNFAVPTLVLDLLRKSSRTSFIFSPQIKLDEQHEHSPELDVIAICDGAPVLGEAKSTDRIEKEQLDILESTALQVKAHRIVLGTTSRDSCGGADCNSCARHKNYADNAFTHGSTTTPSLWGTRERIVDLRERLSQQAIHVTTICAQDIIEGRMLRDRPARIFVPAARRIL